MTEKVEATASKPKRKYVYKDKPIVPANSWPFATEGTPVPVVSKPVRVKQVRKTKKTEKVEVDLLAVEPSNAVKPDSTWPFPPAHCVNGYWRLK